MANTNLSRYAVVEMNGNVRWATEEESQEFAKGNTSGFAYVHRQRRGLCTHKQGKNIHATPTLPRHIIKQQGLLAMERKAVQLNS